MGISGRNCVVAFTRVAGAITGEATNLLVWRDLVQEIGQYGRVPDSAARDLDCRYLQCFLINPDMYLAPEAAFRAAMLAGVPLAFAFALGLDAGAVHKKVQRSR